MKRVHEYDGKLCYCGQGELREPPSRRPASLVELSGRVVVSHDALIDAAGDEVPADLSAGLLDAALGLDRQYAVERWMCSYNDELYSYYASPFLVGVETHEHRASKICFDKAVDRKVGCFVRAFLHCVSQRRTRLRRLVIHGHAIGTVRSHLSLSNSVCQ